MFGFNNQKQVLAVQGQIQIGKFLMQVELPNLLQKHFEFKASFSLKEETVLSLVNSVKEADDSLDALKQVVDLKS